MRISIVIPTADRPQRLRRTLEGLSSQVSAGDEVIVVDASLDPSEAGRVQSDFAARFNRIRCIRSERRGSASQRNQGLACADGDAILFCDDDLDPEAGCLGALRDFLVAHGEYGGVSATIVNQAPRAYGRATRAVLWLIDDRRGTPPDGRIVGPGLNFLPRLDDARRSAWTVEWLNTTCTLYRAAALPSPAFDDVFVGYSMLEDVTLSARVSAQWKLAVLPAARVYHDSQPSPFKRDLAAMTEMELRNRRHLLRSVLRRRGWGDEGKLAIWFAFNVCAAACRGHIAEAWARIRGYRRSFSGQEATTP